MFKKSQNSTIQINHWKVMCKIYFTKFQLNFKVQSSSYLTVFPIVTWPWSYTENQSATNGGKYTSTLVFPRAKKARMSWLETFFLLFQQRDRKGADLSWFNNNRQFVCPRSKCCVFFDCIACHVFVSLATHQFNPPTEAHLFWSSLSAFLYLHKHVSTFPGIQICSTYIFSSCLTIRLHPPSSSFCGNINPHGLSSDSRRSSSS